MKRVLLLSSLLFAFSGLQAQLPVPFGGTIQGAGSSQANPFMQALVKKYNSIFPCPVFTYTASSSGAGRLAVYNGQVTFAVSDTFAPASEAVQPDTFLQIPFILSSTAIIYNLPADFSAPAGFVLKLTAADLCAIYGTGGVTWQSILTNANNNQVYNNPNSLIEPFARSDNSGTTGLFSGYLACSGTTSTTVAQFINWPGVAAGDFVAGSSAMTAAVFSNAGSIGYVGTGDAIPAGFTTTAKNIALLPDAGNPAFFLSPTVNANVAAAQVGAATADACTSLLCVPGAYPIVSAELLDVFATQPTTFIACNVEQFIAFTLSEGQKLGVTGFVPMTQACLAISRQLNDISAAIEKPCIPTSAHASQHAARKKTASKLVKITKLA